MKWLLSLIEMFFRKSPKQITIEEPQGKPKEILNGTRKAVSTKKPIKISQLGIDLIKYYEGFEEKSYKCPAGVWTIGYGHTKGVKEGQTITKAKAETFLKSDVEWAEKKVVEYVKVQLNQRQFDALVSFTFNMGAGALKTSTLLRVINTGQFNSASKEFSRWVFANGVKLGGLVKRRAAERVMWDGNIPNELSAGNIYVS